jgi:hypothetical protein
MPPLGPSGFIDHYITGVIYPDWGTGYVQAAVLAAVIASWAVFALTRRLPTGDGRSSSDRLAGRW